MKMNQKILSGIFALIFTISLIIVPVSAASPGGGVWWTDNSNAIWKSTLSEIEDDGYGGTTTLSSDVMYLQFKAQSVAEGTYTGYGAAINVTGAYGQKETMTAGEDYCCQSGWNWWDSNTSYYVNSTALTQYQGFWNAKDAKLSALSDAYIGLVFVFSPIMLVAMGEFDSSHTLNGEYTNSTVVISKEDTKVNFITTFHNAEDLTSTFPGEWNNASLIMTGEVIYGYTHNVLHTATLEIEMQSKRYHSASGLYNSTSSNYTHVINSIYPEEIMKDRSLLEVPGYPIEIITIGSLIGVVFLLIKEKKKTKLVKS